MATSNPEGIEGVRHEHTMTSGPIPDDGEHLWLAVLVFILLAAGMSWFATPHEGRRLSADSQPHIERSAAVNPRS